MVEVVVGLAGAAVPEGEVNGEPSISTSRMGEEALEGCCCTLPAAASANDAVNAGGLGAVVGGEAGREPLPSCGLADLEEEGSPERAFFCLGGWTGPLPLFFTMAGEGAAGAVGAARRVRDGSHRVAVAQ